MSPRVVLADDHVVLRQGLKALLERQGIEVVGEASDGSAGVELVCELQPDVAVLDIAMPFLNGLEAAHQIAQACPETRVILLTAVASFCLPRSLTTVTWCRPFVTGCAGSSSRLRLRRTWCRRSTPSARGGFT